MGGARSREDYQNGPDPRPDQTDSLHGGAVILFRRFARSACDLRPNFESANFFILVSFGGVAKFSARVHLSRVHSWAIETFRLLSR